jgi:hypothetical protein
VRQVLVVCSFLCERCCGVVRFGNILRFFLSDFSLGAKLLWDWKVVIDVSIIGDYILWQLVPCAII